MSTSIHVEKVIAMIKDMAVKHRGEILSLALDWEIKTVHNVHYDRKVEELVPLLVIDFK